MTTPEERAERIEEATRWWESSSDIPKVRRAITHEIREAVLAERRRCFDLVFTFTTRAEGAATAAAMQGVLDLLDAVRGRGEGGHGT